MHSTSQPPAFAFDRKYLVSLLISALVFAVLLGLGAQSISQLGDSVQQLQQAQRAQAVRAAVTTHLLDLETGARGYLLTRDAAYLAPYRRGLTGLDEALAELDQLLGHNEDMQVLGEFVARKRAHTAQLIALADTDPAAALASVKSGRGMAAMEGARARLAQMAEAEMLKLAQHRADTAASVQQNKRLGAMVLGSLGLALAGVYVLMRRELRTRQQLQQAEHEAMLRLEARVDERTRALRETSMQLELSEAQLRGIFDSASEAIITTDQHHKIVMANAAAALTFGHPLAQLMGASLDVLIPERHRHAYRGRMQAYARAARLPSRAGRGRVVTGLHADGHEFPLEAAISFVHAGGQNLHTVVLRDVTERVRAEQALRESEARLRRLLALLPEPVFVNTGNRVSYVNEAACRLFGASEQELVGLSPLELIHPDWRASVLQGLGALDKGQAAVPLDDLRILQRDGGVREVQATATTLLDGAEHSIVVVLRDVTELHQARRELAESHADLQRLLKSQGEVQEEERKRIARELHDDLQQTLAAIQMDVLAASELAREAAPAVPPLLANAHELADAAIVSTRRIINDLRPQILDDLGLLAALEAMATQFARRTGIRCEVEACTLDGELDELHTQAATCLFRVVQEALHNVAKHAHAAHVVIELDLVDSEVHVRVRDDGRGIDDGDRRKHGSFGLLGMQERVRAIGGRLSVERRTAGGTEVEVVAPFRQATAQPVA